MTRPRDPRLPPEAVDAPEASSAVRTLLAAGASDDLNYDFDRGLAAHLGAVGAVPGSSDSGSGPSSGAAAKTAASGLPSKALLLLIGAPVAAVSLGVALSVGGLGGLRAPMAAVASAAEAPRIAPGAAPAASPSAVAEHGVAEAAPAPVSPGEEQRLGRRHATAEPERPRGAPRLAPPESPEDGPDQTKAAPSIGSAAVGTRLAEGAPHPAPATTGLSAGPSSAASAESERAEEAALEAMERGRKARAEEAARVADQRLEREMSALAETKHALAGDPALALSLARQGDRDFPHGVFAEERRHILILALIRLGRLDEARRLAAPYLEQHPDSPFARRVRTALDAAGAKP